MKTRIEGRKYTKRQVISSEQNEDMSKFLKNFKYLTFDEQLKTITNKLSEFLESKGIFSSPNLYLVANKPIKYVDSYDPKDIEHAIEMWHCRQLLKKSNLKKPAVGKKLAEGIELKWMAERGSEECRCGMSTLEHYVINILERDFDSLEGIAAKIITMANRLVSQTGEIRDSNIIEIGYWVAMFNVYHMHSKEQQKKAKKPRDQFLKPFLIKLASTEKNYKSKFEKLFNLLDAHGADPEMHSYTGSDGSDMLCIYYDDDSNKRKRITFDSFRKKAEFRKVGKKNVN